MPSPNIIKTFTENGYYHVYNRGVEKRRIFEDEEDYKAFLRYLKLYLAPVDALRGEQPLLRLYIVNRNLADELNLLSYCLMPNHFHLLLFQKTKNAITKFMRSLCTAYSMYFNKRYERVGPLFANTYKASHVTTDEYLLHLSRYIHQNPSVRGISLADYPWSSYTYYLGGNQLPWLETQTITEYFNNSKPSLSYQNFVENNHESLDQITPLLLDE